METCSPSVLEVFDVPLVALANLLCMYVLHIGYKARIETAERKLAIALTLGDSATSNEERASANSEWHDLI